MSESDIVSEEEIAENTASKPKPSLGQVKAMINFIQKNPKLAHRKRQPGVSNLWVELANVANSRKGAKKSVNGWIKFWYNKLRNIYHKQTLINEGKQQKKLTFLEQKMLDLCPDNKSLPNKQNNSIKVEFSNADAEGGMENIVILNPNLDFQLDVCDETDGHSPDGCLDVMNTMVDVMKQQALVMSQLADAALTNSNAMQNIAEAQHNQAVAVDEVVSKFEKAHSSVVDVRNAITSINYTLKQYYSANSMQHRHNLNIFN